MRQIGHPRTEACGCPRECSVFYCEGVEERSRRIVEIAVELAQQGGFEAVRQRDVAARAGVALGTLYKRFPSKENLLVAALELETERIVQKLARPASGETPEQRIEYLFRVLTLAFCKKQNLAKALIRAITSGEPEVTERALSYHKRLAEIIARAMTRADGSLPPSPIDLEVAATLQQIWFAALIGWMGGIHSQAAVIERVTRAGGWMLRGIHGQGA